MKNIFYIFTKRLGIQRVDILEEISHKIDDENFDQKDEQNDKMKKF